MSSIHLTSQQLEEVLTPKAIRTQAKKIFDLCLKDKTHFSYQEEKLDETVSFVLSTIKKNYPNYDIPFHSRWGHFKFANVDRIKNNESFFSSDPIEKARQKIDLVVSSVLLDAGAGSQWKFKEKLSDIEVGRSEGLGLASLYLFLDKKMSSNSDLLQADAKGLRNLSRSDLIQAFQVSDDNPLLGLDGRLSLLNNLADSVVNKKIFVSDRPGAILDYLIKENNKQIPAPEILKAVLYGFGPIWPSRITALVGGQNYNLGDVWSHSALGEGYSSLVPIHKLSQWMTYSLIEPIIEAGIEVTNIHELTGLAEYRNGGLLIDSGLLKVRDPSYLEQIWEPSSDFIIEWRALTIYLLDLVAEKVQKALGRSNEEFPLAKVLEGGTWWAGRFLAIEKRKDRSSPVKIKSDGTVF